MNGMISPSVSSGNLNPTPMRMKRQQAVRACNHCKRLHAKCSNERPCKRCENNGLAESCIDSPRKPRMGKLLKSVGLPPYNLGDKHLSIFADPAASMVLTHLDGNTRLNADFKSTFVPKMSPECTKQAVAPAKTNPGVLFKTEKLGPIVQATSTSNGMFSTEEVSPLIFIPSEDKEPSRVTTELKNPKIETSQETEIRSPFSLTV